MQHFFNDKKLGTIEFELSGDKYSKYKSLMKSPPAPVDKNEVHLVNTPKNADGTEAMHGEEYARLQTEIAHDINICSGFVQVEGRGGKLKWVRK